MLRGFTIYRAGEEPERGEAEFTGSIARFLAVTVKPIVGGDLRFGDFTTPDGQVVRGYFAKTEQGNDGVVVVIDEG